MKCREEQDHREELDRKERLVREKQGRKDKLAREVQAWKKNQAFGNGTMEVDKLVRESSRVNRYKLAFNDKEFMQNAFSKQNVKKWKVCDVNWEDNVISEHEETWEDISHRDQNLGQATNFSLRNPKLCKVDLSKEVSEDCAIFENHAIIGRVVGPKLPWSLIRTWVDENWGKNVVIKFLRKSFFIAVFAEAEERDMILCSQNWFLENHPFYLQPWYPNFDPTKLAIYDKPLWVCLYNLPSEYWSNPCLERIGQTLGTLLEIDEAIIDADLYIYARMKIAVVKEIPSSISIITKEGCWVQQVEIETDVVSCSRCGGRQHLVGRCGMFTRRAFKKPFNKSDKVGNHLPPVISDLPPLNGLMDGNIDLIPKDSSHDIGALDEAPSINIAPILDSVSLPPPIS